MQKEDNIEQTIDLTTAIRFPAFLSRTFAITWETTILIFLTMVTLFPRLWMLRPKIMMG